MRLTTANIMNRPRMSQAKVLWDVGRIKAQSTIVGWQEINPARYRQAIVTAGDSDGSKWAHAELDSPIPISVNAAYYEILKSGKRRTHAGRALASPARWVTWAYIRQKSTGYTFVVVNTHFVSGAWNNKIRPWKGWRKQQWREHHKVITELVQGFVDHGYLVLGVGDFNKVAVTKLTRRMRWVTKSGIDKVYIANGNPKLKVRVIELTSIGGNNSDHRPKTGVLHLAKTSG